MRFTIKPKPANLLVNIVQVIQKNVTLRLIQSNDPHGHRSVDPECLPASSGMNTDDGVDAFDEFRTFFGALPVEIRMCRAIDGLTTIDDLAEFGGKLLVSRIA